MKKLFGKDSGNVLGCGGISTHQPLSSSVWFLRSQNSMATPVASWNQLGKPPTVGALLMGPMRVSRAWAGNAANINAAAVATKESLAVFIFIPSGLSSN